MSIKERILEKLEHLRQEQLKALEHELEELLRAVGPSKPSFMNEFPELPAAKLVLIPGEPKPKIGLSAQERPVLPAGAKTSEEILAEMREGR